MHFITKTQSNFPTFSMNAYRKKFEQEIGWKIKIIKLKEIEN